MSLRMAEVAVNAFARHACCTKRLEPVAPRFRIQGLDEELLWPLPPRQVAALRALYPGTSITIPGHQIICLDDELVYRPEYETVSRGIRPGYAGVWTIHSLTIDTTGDAAAWTKAKSHVRAFGTTVHVLPSDALGGAVTVSYDDRSSTWASVDDCVLGFCNACSVHVSPITSGARAMLVFGTSEDDDDDDDDDGRCDSDDEWPGEFGDESKNGNDAFYMETSVNRNPISIATHAQMLDAVAAVADHTDVYTVLSVYHHGALSSMDDLSDHVRDAISFLASTNVLDVAVYSPISNAVLFDPRCHVPASVVAASTRACLLTILSADSITKDDKIQVAYWPKTHRVYFLGFEAATSLVASYVAGGSTDLLGFETLCDLASATISMLREAPLEWSLDVTSDHWASLGASLLDHGDLDLAMDLLFRTTDDRFWTMPTIVCDWFRALVMRYGWHAVLPLFLRCIERTTAEAMHMHLMARLIEGNKLCVRQHHATELLDTVLCLLLERQSSAGHLPRVGSFLNDALRVSLCLADESTDPLVGGIVATRVPPPIVALVESFQPPKWTLVRALRLSTRLQSALPAALLLLQPSGLHLQPYIDLAVHLYETSTGGIGDRGYVTLLQLTHGTPSFDRIFDKALTCGMYVGCWLDLLATPGLQLGPSQTARLVAATTDTFDCGTGLNCISDTMDLSDTLRWAQDGARLFATLDNAPGLAHLLEHASDLEAAHEDPITFVMDFLLPLHDTCIESQIDEVARTLAAHGLPQLTARLAALEASKKTRGQQEYWRWCRRHCDAIVAFAESKHPSTFEFRVSRHCTKRVIDQERLPLRRYPQHIRDVCIKTVRAYPVKYTLINHPHELVEKMQAAANRLQSSLDGRLQASAKRTARNDAPSPKRQRVAS